LLTACGQENANKATTPAATTGKTDQSAAAPAAGPSKNSTPLESIPQATVMKMWDECTYIDYIFHNLPFSMSQDQQESIRTNLSYISTEPQAFIPAQCKPMGRQFFHVNGEIVMEADVYLSVPCKFYVFVENEKPVFANKMTPAGEQFFSNMFSQARPASNPYGTSTPNVPVTPTQ